MYNSKRYVCSYYYYDHAVYISVAVDMRMLTSSNGQLASDWAY